MSNDTKTKLNFWQWLGIAIILIGAIFYIWGRLSEEEQPPPGETPPTQTEDVQAGAPEAVGDPA